MLNLELKNAQIHARLQLIESKQNTRSMLVSILYSLECLSCASSSEHIARPYTCNFELCLNILLTACYYMRSSEVSSPPPMQSPSCGEAPSRIVYEQSIECDHCSSCIFLLPETQHLKQAHCLSTFCLFSLLPRHIAFSFMPPISTLSNRSDGFGMSTRLMTRSTDHVSLL